VIYLLLYSVLISASWNPQRVTVVVVVAAAAVYLMDGHRHGVLLLLGFVDILATTFALWCEETS